MSISISLGHAVQPGEWWKLVLAAAIAALADCSAPCLWMQQLVKLTYWLVLAQQTHNVTCAGVWEQCCAWQQQQPG